MNCIFLNRVQEAGVLVEKEDVKLGAVLDDDLGSLSPTHYVLFLVLL